MVFKEIYRNRRVLITGHTGFKGSWLCAWLQKAGAELCGISLAQRTQPNHYDLLALSGIRSETLDIQDFNGVKRIIAEYLASVRDTRPKEIMPEGGEMPAAPLKKPKTLGEAAVSAREIFNRKKGE